MVNRPFFKSDLIDTKTKRHFSQTQSGFTLIELMVALTLGLLIVAAGLAVFLSSSRSVNFQSGMSDLQQNANFGLSLITHDLRHANLNTVSSQRVNSATLGSGIIFKKENLPSSLQTITGLETDLSTLQNKDTDNTTGTSDRLTIQYTPETATAVNCEGAVVGTATAPASDQVIVQRYYLAESPQQVSGEPKAYSLYCDAGVYPKSGTPTAITGLGTSGSNNAQQLMQRVDAFKVRLEVKDPTGNFRYMTINEYTTAMTTLLGATVCTDKTSTACTDTFLNVVSIEIGILSRSTGKIATKPDADLNVVNNFTIAGQSVTLSGDASLNKKYLCQAVNQVVAIRNTLGAGQ